MAWSSADKAKILAALAAGKSYAQLTAEYGVSSATVRKWEGKGVKPLRTATDSATGVTPEPRPRQRQQQQESQAPQVPRLTYAEATRLRNAVIVDAVEAEIAEARKEARRNLAKISRMAVRRIEDSVLPLRRRKVAATETTPESDELDPDYSPIPVDVKGALYLLNDVLGIKAADNEQALVDEEPASVEITVVREGEEEAARGSSLQLPLPDTLNKPRVGT